MQIAILLECNVLEVANILPLNFNTQKKKKHIIPVPETLLNF